jgi:Mrp family chromosome partitioning ATPase
MPLPPKNTERRPSLERVGTYPTHIATDAGWLSNLANEQIHALATHTLAHHCEHGMRTLAITSAMAGEGKTTVSLALAQKLAAADKRVLLVDLDTHRGTLSRSAALDEVSGAMESSQGNGAAFHSYATSCPGVSIMPTGTIDPTSGVPLLDPERVRRIVRRGLEEYDIVLLDCPPLLPVADTHVIADVADNAILVVRANSTPRKILEQALVQFGKDKFFAAILNRARPNDIPYFREVYGYYRRSST